MKKVGIIDNYISNFHTNTYHKLFHEIAVEENREEYVITHIYAKTDTSPSDKLTTKEWCEKYGAKECASIGEVVDNVDVIMVLAPNNPEMHEELCKIPLESGKKVYIDKTFAPDYETAVRIAEFGKKNGAQFWSSSATRFEPCLDEFLYSKESKTSKITVNSGNVFKIYSIHLIELMNTFMKNGAKSVVCHSNTATLVFEITFKDGRKAFLNQFEGTWAPFALYPEIDGKCKELFCKTDFWKCFARSLLDFFDTGKIPVDIESTIECIAVRSAMCKAKENVGVEIMVEGV
ncbi:MAG: Gfo/Idh/MocA family oxidoreductase [Oscillospiraceae bacterium]|nr:Gfo/Idh/MocA family oxidoreductase [Oscillospiraceae bacterium]